MVEDTMIRRSQLFTTSTFNSVSGFGDATLEDIPSVTRYGTTGNDVLLGLGGDDYLYGLAGDDVLNGHGGSDVMVGGTGHDTYHVDDVGDVVWEWGDQGTDLVYASVDYTLPSGVENLVLTGNAMIRGIGNELDNVMSGNSADNYLDGDAGTDILYGDCGRDMIWGGEGRDYLFGGDGADILWGEDGDDVLDGGAGVTWNGIADHMHGGAGNDTYYADYENDEVHENYGEGTDLVYASVDFYLQRYVENLTLTGSAVLGVGNDEDNVIRGNFLDNQLIAGRGHDTLYGGSGADTFVFNYARGSYNSLEPDYLPDFTAAEGDKIDLSAHAFTFIGTSAFTGVAGQLHINTDTNMLIPFGTTCLEGDTNGDTVADLQIIIPVGADSFGGYGSALIL
jgi:Ca2+-binding RTX toxin-like protein